MARLTVPIYEGGEVYARVRQAKETVGQRRIEAEVTRDQVRATVVSAWGQLEASRAQILAAQAQVQAAEVALSGVREEARVGQRTTLDVLNAQQELLTARVNLITAQRDRVVNSYAVVQAMGRLSTRALGIAIAQYERARALRSGQGPVDRRAHSGRALKLAGDCEVPDASQAMENGYCQQ